MKKFLWFIVCLMTMVTFTSCSSDDDEITEYSIHRGTWADRDSNLKFYFENGRAVIDTGHIWGEFSYTVSDNELIMIGKWVNVGQGGDVSYYKTQLEKVQEELKTARGDRRDHLIDELNRLTRLLREAQKEAQNAAKVYTFKFSIVSLNDMEMILMLEGEKLHLKRIS